MCARRVLGELARKFIGRTRRQLATAINAEVCGGRCGNCRAFLQERQSLARAFVCFRSLRDNLIRQVRLPCFEKQRATALGDFRIRWVNNHDLFANRGREDIYYSILFNAILTY